MTTFQIIIRKIAVYFSKPIWSFIRNCAFWLFRLNEIDWVKNEMVALRACGLESLDEVKLAGGFSSSTQHRGRHEAGT